MAGYGSFGLNQEGTERQLLCPKGNPFSNLRYRDKPGHNMVNIVGEGWHFGSAPNTQPKYNLYLCCCQVHYINF